MSRSEEVPSETNEGDPAAEADSAAEADPAEEFDSGREGPDGPIQPVWALRGAFAFLTRLPIPGGTARDWNAFRRSPWTFPVVGAVVGALAGAAFSLPLPWPTAVAAYLGVLYLLSGVTHADGLADVGDAIAAHDPDRRREILEDSDTGVGGTLALVVVVVGTALGAAGLAAMPVAAPVAVRVVVAAEVGAKLAMALLICRGEPAHEGLGSQLVGVVGPLSALPAVLVAATVLLAPPTGALPALAAALFAGPAVAAVVRRWADGWLGGVSGDLLGAANELARALALHAGVIAWVLL